MTNEQTEGGPEWERNEAARTLAAAVTAADEAAIAEGAARMGDAVTNAAAARLIPTLEKTLKSVVKPSLEQLNATIASLQAHQDQRFAYLIRITELEFKTNAAWRDKYSTVIDRLDAGQDELKADHIQLRAQLTGAITRIDQIEVLLAARPAERNAEHQAIVDEIGTQIHALADRLDRKRTELDELHQWQSQIEVRLAELEARRRVNDHGDR